MAGVVVRFAPVFTKRKRHGKKTFIRVSNKKAVKNGRSQSIYNFRRIE